MTEKPSSLVLFDNLESTNAHKVRFLLAELGLAAEHRLVVLHEPTDDYRALHPFGLVPTLVDGEVEAVVTESNVALRYLAERADRSDLRGETPARRACVDILLDSLSLEVQPPLWELERLVVYGHPGGDAEAAVARDNLRRTLQAYERLLDPDGPHALGNLTIADCAIAGRLYHFDRLGLDAGDVPRVRRVLDAARRLPSWTAGVTGPVARADAR